MNIHLVSLGCARNLVDSEIMIGRLAERKGFQMIDDPSSAEVIIVNTCSFIQDAIEESIDTILELAEYKKQGKLKNLIVAGCLPERFKNDIESTLPEVDAFIGTGAYDQIGDILEKLQKKALGKKTIYPDPDILALQKYETPRLRSTMHMAYVKIAEGCSSRCTYCIIPKLRGRHRSRAIEDIRKESLSLVSSGVKELVLIAQESTFYGKDLVPPQGLAGLLDTLSGISPHIWIRVLYGHPQSMAKDMIKTIKTHDNICAYFDLPVQHASGRILKKMGRRYNTEFLKDLFLNIRSEIPAAALRTTLITGFPGETEEDFDCLVEFVNDIRFDSLGVFTYSDADDLPSHHLPNPVSYKVARERQDHIMAMQAEISLERNHKHLNKTYTVLVEENPEKGLFVGRTVFQAPEVDGVTFIRGESLTVGDFVDVCINDVEEYDISGELI
ncbi:MAG: 30S ribosomal protein S12 methylthiotransferase RimO [Proteobacteria bacterium]|nr:30S ribosomal protein S12 methylthiotransferase RimO [Pseudomonadota bacterium]